MTTAKKTAVAKSIDTDDAVFAQFRDRALTAPGLDRKQGTVSNEPFVLGEEYGFDPAIALAKPSLKMRMLIQDATKDNRPLDVLRYVFGSDVNRFLDTIDEYEERTGESADLILNGVMMAYTEHFYGKGALAKGFTYLSI